MNYIENTLQKNISDIDKLYGLLENALIDYEYTSLLESETLLLPEKGSKDKKVYNIKKIILTIISKLKKLCDTIGAALSNMMKNIIGSQIYYVANTDIEIGPYTRDKFPESICNKIVSIKNNSNDNDIESLENDLDKCIDEEQNQKITIIKGTKIDIVQCLRHLKTNNKYRDIIDKKVKNDNSDDPKVFRIYKKMINFLMLIGKHLSEIISNCKLFKKDNGDVRIYDKNGNKVKSLANSRIVNKNDRSMRNYNKAHGINNESSYIPYDMTKNEYIASIMLEAAELLKEDNYDSLNGGLEMLLEEAVEYDIYNIEYLNEAVDGLKEINLIKNSLKKGKEIKTNQVEKIKKSIDNLLKWYFKIEPNKKFKALHVLLSALSIILDNILIVAATVGSIGGTYNGSIYGIGKALKLDTGKTGKAAIVFALISLISITLSKIINTISINANMEFNLLDYNKNVKLIKSQINKIDNQIKKVSDDKKQVNELNKLKKQYINTISKLNSLKNQYNYK